MLSTSILDAELIEASIDTAAGPAAVMDVLADGWMYAAWFVGPTHIRHVDAGWPNPGAVVRHSVGAWPLLVDRNTEVLAYDPRGSLHLLAGGSPMGSAVVRIAVEATSTGSRIELGERMVQGPGTHLGPLERVLVLPRNREALLRLKALAERR